MNYQSFAYIYDQLMDEAPYEQWMDFFKRQAELQQIQGKKVLDLACGTGELSIRLYEEGYEVTGVDLSEDMLAVASSKAINKGFHIPFFQQDMTMLEGLEQFDAAVIFCDSLNYLLKEEDFLKTFQSVHRVLKEGGLLLFDVHSMYKVNAVYPNKTFAYNGEDVSYIWNSFKGEVPDSVEHELTFFVYNEANHMYERYDELHKQRTFSLEQYKRWLEEAGFQTVSVEADFHEQIPNEQSERIFITAIKK